MTNYLANLDGLRSEVAAMSEKQQFDRLVELTAQLRLAREKWQQLFSQADPDNKGEMAALLDQTHELDQQISDLKICLEEAGQLDLKDPKFYQGLDQAVHEQIKASEAD